MLVMITIYKILSIISITYNLGSCRSLAPYLTSLSTNLSSQPQALHNIICLTSIIQEAHGPHHSSEETVHSNLIWSIFHDLLLVDEKKRLVY